jgi:serine/threonine protein phosphatase PrpC
MAQKIGIRSSALTHPGRKRSHNEDFVAYFEPGEADVLQASGRLYIIADGVGGASEGERASQYAAEKVLYEYYQQPEADPGERLRRSLSMPRTRGLFVEWLLPWLPQSSGGIG